jgi:hypothetical protein
VKDFKRVLGFALTLIFVLGLFLLNFQSVQTVESKTLIQSPGDTPTPVFSYLPLVDVNLIPTQESSNNRRVNLPYFPGAADIGNDYFGQTAIFWYGYVRDRDNSGDVRLGYNDQDLFIYAANIDRRLWYDTTPSLADLTNWDSISIYLSTDGSMANSYRFVSQLRNQENSSLYQKAYRWNGSSWAAASSINFLTIPGWRGEWFNNDVDDKGWAMTFYIPFTSLGLSGPPQTGTSNWKIAVRMYDRDDGAGTPIADKFWPETFHENDSSSWGTLAFGIPTYTPPASTLGGSVTIRSLHQNGDVYDGQVGGWKNCGGSLDYWTEWGDANYYYNDAHELNADLNVQNQSDLSDYVCFSRLYITFPLNSIPAGKIIRSATMTLHQFGASSVSNASPSWIQVFRISDDWNSQTLTWNNSPLAFENLNGAWAYPTAFTGWNNTIVVTWDISRAVALAYAANQPLRLALYDSDSDYNSGKFFVGSNTGDWNIANRPSITVIWGNP